FRRRDPRRAMVAQALRASKAAPEPPQTSTPQVTHSAPEPPPDNHTPIENCRRRGNETLINRSSPLPSVSTAQIRQENCLQCGSALPPLTSEGKHLNEHCSNCGIPLPPPGCCTQPSDDQCFNCGAALPHRLPNGRRPLP